MLVISFSPSAAASVGPAAAGTTRRVARAARIILACPSSGSKCPHDSPGKPGSRRTPSVNSALPGERETWSVAVSTSLPSQRNVNVAGNLFQVFLNRDKLFEAEDGTFSNAGKIGLWTKADSVTYFDDLSITVRR